MEGGLTSCNGPDERLLILKRLIFALTWNEEGKEGKICQETLDGPKYPVHDKLISPWAVRWCV